MKTIFLLFLFIADLAAQSSFNSDKVEKARQNLGHRLFYDADLSINGTIACATCHEQRRGFSDGNRVHPGALNDNGKRNVPTLANVGKFKNLTWSHNYLSGLAEQSLAPIRGTQPVEMGMYGHEEEIAKRLSKSECYQKLFLKVFPDQNGTIDLSTVTQALESFEKTLISNNSLYDQMKRKDRKLPTKDARDGEKLFFKAAKCNSCHTAPLFSDDAFHQIQPKNLKVYNGIKDNGLFDVTGNEKDKNVFRTPSLRNVSLSFPYWHDGSATTLQDAIKKHNLKTNHKLSSGNIKKIIAFLNTLSDESFIKNPQFGKPSVECQEN